MKICKSCNIEKPESEFRKINWGKGRYSICKKCVYKDYEKPRSQKPEVKKQMKENQRKWYRKPENKIKCREWQKKYYSGHKETFKKSRLEYEKSEKGKNTRLKIDLKHNYKISLEDYKNLLAKQNNVCAICGKPETRKIGDKVLRLTIDHSHVTGKIRGLLCAHCNMLLGRIETNIKFIHKMLVYIIPE